MADREFIRRALESDGAQRAKRKTRQPTILNNFGRVLVAQVNKERRKTNATKRIERGAATVDKAKDFLSLAQAGALLGVSPETVRFWIWKGKLKATKPGRLVLVRRRDLEALVDDASIGAPQPVKRHRASRK
jgi:excisionase family DNA binding protein